MSHIGSGAVQKDWHSTAEGETILQQFYNVKASGRKLFGILERPAVFSYIEEVSYKLCFLGRSGSGKTSTISRFAGVTVGTSSVETGGIRVTDVYWPVKVWDKIILFKLQCWDAGCNSMKKYSHISLSCHDKADLLVYIFSYNEASSFAELPSLINASCTSDNQPASLVIGTRSGLLARTQLATAWQTVFNQLESTIKNLWKPFKYFIRLNEYTLLGYYLIVYIYEILEHNPNHRHSHKLDVSSMEVKEFEINNHLQVLTMPLVSSVGNETTKMAPILNTICELLWIRDQHYIMNQSVTV